MDTAFIKVSIAEGKKNFSSIIKASEEKKQKIIICRRGNPVAIILPYEEYCKNKKEDALRRIKEVRQIYHKLGVKARETYEISRKELEKGP